MTPAAHAWLEGLRESAEASRRRAPEPPAGEPAAAAAERMILAAHLATWLDATPDLLAARREFARSTGPAADPEAAIVITTSPLGIAVVGELLGNDGPLVRSLRPRVACVTEREYRAWCIRQPDERHLLHVNHWSWIKTRLPPQRATEFARHPLPAGQSHWLHRTGMAGAGEADGRAAHLWKFTGRHAVLLEPFVVEGAARPPR